MTDSHKNNVSKCDSVMVVVHLVAAVDYSCEVNVARFSIWL